jgi:probable F420-dependent oxidoreductase
VRGFRFMLTLPAPQGGRASWRDALLAVEDAGIDTVAAADHFTGGWLYEPLVSLAAAAELTTSLRLQTNVLCNDYRHPVQVHRMAATLDVVSGGRFELGIGGGWLRTDYEAAGLPFDDPGVRIGRLEESVKLIKSLFETRPCTFRGEHYRVEGLIGVPSPVQRPRPPIFLGGGGRRVLSLAGREADIVGVHSSLRGGEITSEVVAEMTPRRVGEKVAWVREAAAARGPEDVELHMNFRLCAITRTAAEARERVARYAASWKLPESAVASSPQVLAGTAAQCAEGLLQRREELGISYFHFDPQSRGEQGDLDGYRRVVELARAQEGAGSRRM